MNGTSTAETILIVLVALMMENTISNGIARALSLSDAQMELFIILVIEFRTFTLCRTEPAGSNGLLLFEFYPDANTPRYKILVIKRAPSEWIEWNTRVPDNINTEVMWQLAQIEEWKWKPQMPLNEIRNILIELQNSLPEGIDDSVRDLILNTWKQRWMERAAQSMLSSETGNQITAAVNSFKIIMNDL